MCKGLAMRTAIFSLLIPKALGVTSQKITMIIVMTAVAIPIPISPKTEVAIAPAMTDAKIFTMLLPTTIALITSSGVFIRQSRTSARLSPFLVSSLTRALLTEINAISEPEKNADNTIQKTIAINPITIQIMVNI